MITKRVILLALVSASLGISGVSKAMAQAYPSRPITMVVPYSAGGPTDTIARIMAEGMRASLGQTIIVENTTGAAGGVMNDSKRRNLRKTAGGRAALPDVCL
jgi:tripartite-type tricarboxylate transporter receptor subunit TctC